MNPWLTDALGHDAAAVLGVDDPVVVLEGVHRLEYRAHPPDVGEDLRVSDEVGRQVGVQLGLYLWGGGEW